MGFGDQKLAGFKPCPLERKDEILQLAVGHTDLNGRGSQGKTPIGAVGDDPPTHQESVNSGQTGNPRPLGRGGCQLVKVCQALIFYGLNGQQ